jgi:hypothetical protein
MNGWLTNLAASGSWEFSTVQAFRLGSALLMGVVVAGLNRWARRGEQVAPTFQTTLVLLAGLIAMSTQIIGDNIARAFSLAGALSVVRFRTVVRDTQDTAFVIMSVVVGMAAGANLVAVGVTGLIVHAVASLMLWPPGNKAVSAPSAVLSFRVSQNEPARQSVEAALAGVTTKYDLIAAGSAKKGASMDLTYRVILSPGRSPADLVAEMIRTEGVEDVQFRQDV